MSERVLHLYEAMFLLEPSIATDWEAAKGMVQTIMDRASAELLVCRLWDERRLAYPIKKQKRAAYIICYFKADGSSIGGIERDTRLSEHLLRVLVLRADHITDEQLEEIKDAPDRHVQPITPARQPVGAHVGRPKTITDTDVATQDSAQSEASDSDQVATETAEPQEAEKVSSAPEQEAADDVESQEDQKIDSDDVADSAEDEKPDSQ